MKQVKTVVITMVLTLMFGLVGYSQVAKTGDSKHVGSKTFVATAYCLKGKMANGQRVHQGAIAADRKVLPLGTRVTIVGRGTYIVKDTGGAIRGNKIDIWMPSCKDARQFGRRKVQVIVHNKSTKLIGSPIKKKSNWIKIRKYLLHINGQSQDNRLENLRILCPNCHAQTETYCAKNIAR